MKQILFVFSISFSVLLIQSTNADDEVQKKVASITLNDIRVFRAKSYVEPINGLQDLNSNSTEMSSVLEKMKELDQAGFDLLNTVPDNDATCSVQVKYYISAIINRAKEQCDYCVVRHINKENRTELNAEQKFCSLDALGTALQELNRLKSTVEQCRLKN